MVSSAGDLTRFFSALVRGRLLPARQLAAMKTAVRGSGGGYGLGVKLAFTRCGRAIGHDGSIVGYHNIVWATLDGRRAAAVMVNIEGRVSWNRLREAAYAALCTG